MDGTACGSLDLECQILFRQKKGILKYDED